MVWMTGAPLLGSLTAAAVAGAVIGALLTWLVLRASVAARLVGLTSERDVARAELATAHAERERVEAEVQALQEREDADQDALLALVPLRESLARVERQVRSMERDRVQQFGLVGERLESVARQTAELGQATTSLAGSLQSSGVRGSWGEAQLRRVVELAGMLDKVDFDEQVQAVSAHDARVRPDMVVRLPGDKVLVLDAKAPMTAFLEAQTEGLAASDRTGLLAAHARSLRGHVDALAAKQYWSAFRTTPQMVVCFVPGDAMLAAALQADAGLYDHALARKVVLASPATVMALLRTVAFTWQQDAMEENAKELLALGQELYGRLSTLGGHVERMGGQLRRSVETYNQLVGTLESRVLVSARRFEELGVLGDPLPQPAPVESSPRPFTTAELIASAEAQAYGPGGEGPAVQSRSA